MGRGRRSGSNASGALVARRPGDAIIPLSDDGAPSRVPEVVARAYVPTGRMLKIREVQALLHELDPYFTSTRNLSKACGQMEITLRPWWTGQKCPSSEGQIEKIRRVLSFLPKLDPLTGSKAASGLWLVSPHYGFPFGEHGPHRYGLTYPCSALHQGREDIVLACAADDFQAGSAAHRTAIAAYGHELLPGGKILCHDPLSESQERESPTLVDSPYFHRCPKIGKTLAEKR